VAAEAAWWDGLFLWDHVVHDKRRRRRSFGDPCAPFEVVLGGTSPTDAAGAHDMLGPLIEAGATWWDERRPVDEDRLEPVLRRIAAGPAAF
jgi:hypothetical protein